MYRARYEMTAPLNDTKFRNSSSWFGLGGADSRRVLFLRNVWSVVESISSQSMNTFNQLTND